MIEGTQISIAEKVLQNKPNASINGTISFRAIKDLEGCSIVINLSGQLQVKQNVSTLFKDFNYSLLEYESRIWKTDHLKAGYHKIPFKIQIKNAEQLSPTIEVEDNISINYTIKATFLRPNPIHPKQSFSIPISVIQSTEFITQLLGTPTGFLITNKRDDPDSGYNSPSGSPLASPMTTVSIPSTNSTKSKFSLFKKQKPTTAPTITSKNVINYELFSKKQTVVAGYTHSADLSWDFGDELPGQKSNVQKVRMITVSFIQTTRVLKLTPTFEKSVVIQTYDIQFQGADATRTSQKVIAKVPANAAPSFESFSVTNFYMMKVEVFFERKQKPSITVETPVVVMSRSEGPADSAVKHSGLPYLEREDSLNEFEDDRVSRLSLVTEENLTYVVNYPYSPHHPDEVQLVPGDEVIVK
ncbi:hypothetical protein HK098_002527 [Nowakowskiella sp. JEL0407]|nr:hypothetical protein HK098_002527 [Nowakowskiella sp. JEL0407]